MREEILFQSKYEDKRTTGNSFIKVIGVGGGGGNAVRHMYSQGIVGVDYLVSETNRQTLENNPVPSKLVLGDTGWGAGADPLLGKELALQSREKIREFIGSDTKVLFIAAGMGKGTGTGASPVVAEIAKEMDILTIAVVTYPFSFEGITSDLADAGIVELKKHVDALIVINNDKVCDLYADIELDQAFAYVDDVVLNAVKCIAELITVTGQQDVDLKDVIKVMKNSGYAMIGIATAEGDHRAEEVVENAMNCPLLDNSLIQNAKKLLYFITYNTMKVSEFTAISKAMQKYRSSDCKIIWGRAQNKSLGEQIKLSVIVADYQSMEEPEIINPNIKKETEEITTTPLNRIEVIEKEKTIQPFNEPQTTLDTQLPVKSILTIDDLPKDDLSYSSPKPIEHAEERSPISFLAENVPSNVRIGTTVLSEYGSQYSNDQAFAQQMEIPAWHRVKSPEKNLFSQDKSFFEMSDKALYDINVD